jgi:GDPmannose 4,6-dehydratase
MSNEAGHSGKVALISGISGQDGSYMAEHLLKLGYEVHGIVRRKYENSLGNAAHLEGTEGMQFHFGDLTDVASLRNVILEEIPQEIHEVYHLGAQSHVGYSFNSPDLTFDTNLSGTRNLFQVLQEKVQDLDEPIRVYSACTSEMFGRGVVLNPDGSERHEMQNERTPFNPRSPYAVSKVAQFHLGNYYNENYGKFGLQVWNGIAFNHESERRPVDFVTRKITRYVAGLAQVGQHTFGRNRPTVPEGMPKLKLGNLEASRDWGYAPDFVDAFHLMLQLPEPEAFVVATGETRTIRDLLTVTFTVAGGFDWHEFVVQDPTMMRPADVPYVCGDSSKLREVTGWVPETPFSEMIMRMIQADLEG